jgi:hypothetical protein
MRGAIVGFDKIQTTRYDIETERGHLLRRYHCVYQWITISGHFAFNLTGGEPGARQCSCCASSGPCL